MPDFSRIFAVLKPVMAEHKDRLAVQKDTSSEYSLVTKGPSPFPQHKGHPMWFGAVKLGKAYVSFHLMPLYMSPTLEKGNLAGAEEADARQDMLQFQIGPG